LLVICYQQQPGDNIITLEIINYYLPRERNVPENESSRERKFQRAKVPRTFAPGSESSRERKFSGAKVPGTFAPKVLELSLPERKFHTMVLSLPGMKVLGAKVPVTHGSFRVQGWG